MTGAFISLLLIVFVITLILSVNSLMKKQCSYIFTKPPADADKIDGYAKAAVELLAGAKIINGYNDGSFRPQGSLTRAEAAKVIYGIVAR